MRPAVHSGDAAAQKRIALVIGNSQYINVRPLANPENDATAIAALFKAAGFDVVDAINNLPGTEMRRAFRDFAEKSRTADIAVVFFAGHGIEIEGTNYLLPVDTSLKRDIDVEDEAVSLDRIVRILEPAKRLAPDHSRRVPGQSVRADGAAHQRNALGRARPRQDRADLVGHADRIRRAGRLDRGRRRR